MENELTYDDFIEYADPKLVELLLEEESKYGDGECTIEQWYYANIKWITKQLDIPKIKRRMKLRKLNNGKNMEF